jgi:hypothetical protein
VLDYSRRGPPARFGRTCNCKNSKCLKLYCECFASGEYCRDCNCVGCENTAQVRACVCVCVCVCAGVRSLSRLCSRHMQTHTPSLSFSLFPCLSLLLSLSLSLSLSFSLSLCLCLSLSDGQCDEERLTAVTATLAKNPHAFRPKTGPHGSSGSLVPPAQPVRVCVCVCVCVCVRACVFVCLSLCLCLCVCACVNVQRCLLLLSLQALADTVASGRPRGGAGRGDGTRAHKRFACSHAGSRGCSYVCVSLCSKHAHT